MRQFLLSLFVLTSVALLLALNNRPSDSISDYTTATTDERDYCGFNLAWQELLSATPGLLEEQERLEAEYAREQKSAGLQRNEGPPYTIPVVFHIVHEGGTENISDAAIQTSLDFLNQSFANEGPYDPSTGVPTEIDFCLAKRTPDGTLSTGVERINHPLTNLNMSEDLDLKNLSRYDPTQYLNIWVVREICGSNGCGVAGYAYFPSAHGGGVDGIVVEARWLGNSPGGSSVLTHEIGHYLGLYHTFEGGCQNNDCLIDGDRVCDTPPDQSTAAVPCNASPNSCTTDTDSGFATDQADMFQNYMDYGDWNCYSAFTDGQRERMHFFLEGTRVSLLSSQGCLDPCTIPITVTITSDFSDFVALGESVDFTASGSIADTYTWLVDGTEVGTGNPFSHTFTTVGSFSVSVEATNSDPNCLATAETTASVRCPVQASFSASSTNIGAGSVVYFTNESSNGSSFEWQVDGSTAGTDMGFFYQFDNVGTYVVSLLADNGNCTDDFSMIITVGLTGTAQAGLPIWPMQGGSNGGFHTLDWRPVPPLSSTVAPISDEINGATGAAFNSCGGVVFFVAHTAEPNTPNQLFIYSPDGTPLLTNSTPNAPGLNAVRAGEMQVIPVPDTQDEWYIIYRIFSSDSGAPLNNAAYLPLEFVYSRIRLESDGSLSVVVRDQMLLAGGTAYTYSDGSAVSRTVEGDASRHYLYVGRRALNQSSLSLDRFIIDASGITWESNTGTVPATYWNLTHAGSPVELSPTEDRVVVGSRNQWSNYVDYVIFPTDNFSNTAATSIITDNLLVVADGQTGDESNVLPVNLRVNQLSGNNSYPLQFLRNFPHKISKMEFSPNGRFLYLVGGGFQSGSSQLTTMTYLAQIDLETNPLQVRLQIQAPPSNYNPSTGLGCAISQCLDQWKSIGDLESSYDGNLYFTKRNENRLYVIPNPNSFLPQKLVPGTVDLATADEPNIDLPGAPGILPDQIDGFNYLSAQARTVELSVFGLDCAGDCRPPFDIEVISNDESYRETFTITACPSLIPICADTLLSYRIVDLELGLEYANAIVNGEVNAPAGGASFEFSEPQGCPEDCDEPYVYFYGEGTDYGGRTLLSHDGFLFIGGRKENEALLSKMTPAGEVIWTQVMQPIPNLPNAIVDLKIDSEGLMIGAGSGQSGADIESFAFRMDPDNGALIWTQTYADPSSTFFSVTDIFEPNAGGDYVLLGGALSTSSALGCDASFYNINRNDGDIIGNGIHYHLGSCEEFQSAVVRNGVFYMTGRFNFAGGGANRMRPAILSTNSTGVAQWSRLYLVGVNQDARLYSSDIIQDGPNNLAVLAHGDDDGVDALTNDAWIFRTNLAGNAQWAVKYTFPEAVSGLELVGLTNGYILMVQSRVSNNAYIVRVNGAGDVIWAKELQDLETTSVGDELIVEGNFIYFTTTHLGATNNELALVRMDLETGELPNSCIPNTDLDISSLFITAPYAGFNSITPNDTEVDGVGTFSASPDVLDPLPISCAPACGPEDCDNGIDDDGDGLTDCEDPDCDCEEDCPDASFVKVFGNPDVDEVGYSMVNLPNGNLLLGAGSDDYIQLMELTPDGALVQEQKFSTPDIGIITDLFLDSDGMIVGCGRIGNTAATVRSIAFRYDYTSQSLLWFQESALSRSSYSIFETSPGGDFIFSGSRLNAPFPGAGDDISWIALDRNTGLPNFAVSTNESLSGPDGYYQSIVHNDKVYHAGRLGTTSSPNRFYSTVARYSLDGTAEWRRILHRQNGTDARLYAQDIDEYEDELYVLSSGDDDGSSSTNTTIFIYKMSTDGDLLWTQEYDIPGLTNDWGHEMVVVSDGLLVYGDELLGDSDLFLFKVDFDGNVLWAKRYLAPGSEFLSRYATQQFTTINDNIYLSGATESFGPSGSRDILFMRTTPDGTVNADCLPFEELDLVASLIEDASASPITLDRYSNSMNFDVSNLSPLSLETPLIEDCLALCQEICDNDTDDDGDGFIDCDDPDLADDCCCFVPPVLELGDDIVRCENGVVVLDAGPGFETYQWSDLTTEQTLTTLFPGLYSVTVTDRCGNEQADSIMIIVDPSDIDLGPDVALCPGETLTLSVDGFDTYEWFPEDGFDCNNCPTVTYTASGSDTIIVVATTDAGCISTDTLLVSIGGEQPGTFDTAELCDGDTLSFGDLTITEAGLYIDTISIGDCVAIDSLEVSILPTFDTNEEVNICAGETIIIFGTEEVSEPGVYSMDFTASNGCDSTHSVTVNVLDPVNTSEDLSVCAGESISIFGNPESMAGEYSMTFDGSNGCDSTHTIILSVLDTFATAETLQICNGSSVDIFGVAVSEAGDYSMTFMAENGCDSTHTITVEVLDELTTEEDIEICPGETADIFGTPTDIPGAYSMTFEAENGCDSIHTINLSVLDTVATSELLRICEGETADIFGNLESNAGDYSMTFMGINGCDSTHTITLSILDTVATSEMLGLCPGGTVTVFNETVDEAGDYSMTFPAENGCDSTHTVTVFLLETFTTSESQGLCPGGSIIVFGDTVDEVGDYSMTFTAENGCDSTHTVSVFLLDPIASSEDQGLCPGGSVVVFGDNVTEVGDYSMTFTAENGCDSIHTVSVFLLETFATSETVPDQCAEASVEIFGNTVTTSGSYSETFTAENGCDSTHTVTVTFLPPNETAEEIFICEGESVEVFGEMVDEPGVYSDTFTTTNGCDSTHTITIVAEEFTGSANIFPPCPDDPDSWIVYIRTIGNGGPYTVTWNGIVAVDNTINNIPVGDHVAEVTSANGCMYTVEFTIRPYNQPWWGLVSGPSCNDPKSGSIQIQTEPSDEMITFSLDGENFSPASTLEGLEEGDYVLYVKYGERCVFTDTLSVPGPEEFSLVLPDDQVIEWGESLPIIPTTNVGPGAVYKWSPYETLDCANCDKVVAAPTETTRYYLEVTDAGGCTQIDDILVKVDRRIPYYVPNVFSPNGDGRNDFFTVFGDDRIEEVERMIIFDRWGGQVYTREMFPPNREQLGWNGMNRKQEINTGVYVYYLELRLATGEVVMVKGDVVLMK